MRYVHYDRKRPGIGALIVLFTAAIFWGGFAYIVDLVYGLVSEP